MFINFVLKNTWSSLFKCGTCMMHLYRKGNIHLHCKINYSCITGALGAWSNYQFWSSLLLHRVDDLIISSVNVHLAYTSSSLCLLILNYWHLIRPFHVQLVMWFDFRTIMFIQWRGGGVVIEYIMFKIFFCFAVELKINTHY